MYKILGIQKVNYTNKSGNLVCGVRLHCSFEDNRVDGLAVETIYVSSKVCSDTFSIGDEIEVFYNRFGSVEKVILFN